MIMHLEAAERSVLGAVFLRNEALSRVELRPDDFFDPRHRAVWLAMQGLSSQKRPIDAVTVEAQMGADKLRAIGGLAFIADLLSERFTADNIEHYAAIVADCALTRQVKLACSELAHSQLEGEELLQRALTVVLRISAGRAEGAASMAELAPQTLAAITEQLERQAKGEIASTGILTGLDQIDGFLGGLQTGVVTVLGGRPSMGKSSLARTIADNAARAGLGVHVFSLEDRRSAYARRALSDHSRVDLARLNTLRLDEEDVRRLGVAVNDVSYKRWLVDDIAGLSAQQIAIRVRRHLEENKTRLVVVDYAQIMREPEARRDDKRMQVAISCEGLHELARAENIAILLVSQLNRNLEARDNKRPQLSDLREAGELEQIADAVLFCYRDEVYHPNGNARGQGEVIIAKNKHGRPGTAYLQWDAPTATYRNSSPGMLPGVNTRASSPPAHPHAPGNGTDFDLDDERYWGGR